MNYADALLLSQFARAQYRAAAAKVDPILRDLDESQVNKSTAYRKLRRWFEELSPAQRVKARDFLRDGIKNAGKEQTTDDHDNGGQREVGSGDEGRAAAGGIESDDREAGAVEAPTDG